MSDLDTPIRHAVNRMLHFRDSSSPRLFRNPISVGKVPSIEALYKARDPKVEKSHRQDIRL